MTHYFDEHFRQAQAGHGDLYRGEESVVIARFLSGTHVPGLRSAEAIGDGRITIAYLIAYDLARSTDLVERERRITQQLRSLKAVALAERRWAVATRIPVDGSSATNGITVSSIHDQIDSYFLANDRVVIADIMSATGLELLPDFA
jgi:hypothetical protein